MFGCDYVFGAEPSTGATRGVPGLLPTQTWCRLCENPPKQAMMANVPSSTSRALRRRPWH